MGLSDTFADIVQTTTMLKKVVGIGGGAKTTTMPKKVVGIGGGAKMTTMPKKVVGIRGGAKTTEVAEGETDLIDRGDIRTATEGAPTSGGVASERNRETNGGEKWTIRRSGLMTRLKARGRPRSEKGATGVALVQVGGTTSGAGEKEMSPRKLSVGEEAGGGEGTGGAGEKEMGPRKLSVGEEAGGGEGTGETIVAEGMVAKVVGGVIAGGGWLRMRMTKR